MFNPDVYNDLVLKLKDLEIIRAKELEKRNGRWVLK